MHVCHSITRPISNILKPSWKRIASATRWPGGGRSKDSRSHSGRQQPQSRQGPSQLSSSPRFSVRLLTVRAKREQNRASRLSPHFTCGVAMSDTDTYSRRQFLRGTLGGGFALGGLLGLGLDLRAAQQQARRFKFAHTREVPSVCPYCAVGCGQLVSVRDNRIVNIEGNPDSPISRGTLCPKGAATYQLAVNENRVTQVWYRAPGAKDWDKTKTLAWAMERIARRVKETRDATFR